MASVGLSHLLPLPEDEDSATIAGGIVFERDGGCTGVVLDADEVRGEEGVEVRPVFRVWIQVRIETEKAVDVQPDRAVVLTLALEHRAVAAAASGRQPFFHLLV